MLCPPQPWSVPRPFEVSVRPNSETGTMTTSSHRPIALISVTKVRSAALSSSNFSSSVSWMSEWVSNPPMRVWKAARSAPSCEEALITFATCSS